MSDFTMRFLESNTKLTHDDIEKILNYQEKAKEWDKATTLDSYEEFLIQKEIIERLKKFFNEDNVLTKQEFQKIIEGKKK